MIFIGASPITDRTRTDSGICVRDVIKLGYETVMEARQV